jgi:hypothetical protein
VESLSQNRLLSSVTFQLIGLIFGKQNAEKNAEKERRRTKKNAGVLGNSPRQIAYSRRLQPERKDRILILGDVDVSVPPIERMQIRYLR